MTDFLETPRFDTDISYGSSGGPGFKTYIFLGDSGREGSTITWSSARGRYSVSESIRDATDMDAIRTLFYACLGRAIGFRFKDWGDFTATNEAIGTGDGTNRVFKLKKTYSTYVRRIFKPVSGTVSVKVDGVTIDPTHYTVDTTTGTITFGALYPPADTKPVTATFEFDVPVRFDTDTLEASVEDFDVQSWTTIPLIEIKLED